MRGFRLPILSLVLGLVWPLAAASAGQPTTPSLSREGQPRSCRYRSLRSSRRTLRRAPPIPWLRGGLPNVQAQGALVLDLDGGEELFARRADEPRPIASISKLAATLTAVDRGLDLDAHTTVTHVDAQVAHGGARSRLLEGMTLSNRDLLHAALLGSDNRAVSALGRAVGLSAGPMAEAMTATARRLGLRETRFVEPTGISPQNRSTPRELITLLRAVMDHPVLGPITRTLQFEVHPLGRRPIHYSNTYRPATRANSVVLGGKTGFNNAARYCLVFAAKVGGRRLGMAFLGTEGELTRFGDVARVSDWVVARRSRPVAVPEAAPVTDPVASPEFVPDPSEEAEDPEVEEPGSSPDLPPTATAEQPGAKQKI